MPRTENSETGKIRIEIEPVWRFRREDSGQSMLVMLDFLNEIRATGKITRAAGRAQMSYRHCWNLIEKWAAFFGAPLVTREQGRGTKLTALGDKLVWAGQRLQARLRPQLQNLAQELESEINEILPQPTHLVRIHASHGFAVSKLREMLLREPHLGIDLRYVSNQNSLVSLAGGACEVAGVHLPQGELRKQAVADLKPWLVPAEQRVIGLVTREMGLMVNAGMSAIAALKSATSVNAELLGLESKIGTLEAGKRADIIALPGDPGENIRVTEKVMFVMKDGKVVRNLDR